MEKWIIPLIIAFIGTGSAQYAQALSPASQLPFWLPWAFPHDIPLKYFHVVLTHVNPEMNLIRTCITDINSTHGVCNYMNVTEQENLVAGDDIKADAGIFAFPPKTFPINDTLQICVKIIGLNEEHCMWDLNRLGVDEVTRYGADMSTFKPGPQIVQRPDIINQMNSGGSAV
jgi:hypothetical protein